MAPNLIGNTFLLAETGLQPEPLKRTQLLQSPANVRSKVSLAAPQVQPSKQSLEVTPPKAETYRMQIVWRNIVAFTVIHLFAVYGFYLLLTENLFLEYVWGHAIGVLGGFGITAGAHRLWAHRSYKAKWPLRVFLMICQTIAFQNSLYEWVRDHRVHHKFTDTHADPHNSRRGFFFCHVGWLLVKKHPDVRNKGKTIDMSDLEADPIVMFQKKHYMILMPLCCFIIPALVPYFLLDARMSVCFYVCSILRWVLSLHFTWLVNSAAHMWGMKPYDKSISSTDNKLVAILAYGEGWHNYHHVFPWDYKAAELGKYALNFSTAVIDFFAKIGWAYDLKTVSDDMIRKRVARTGDGTHNHLIEHKKTEELVVELNEKCNHDDDENHIWGWDDQDMTEDDRKDACILNKSDAISN